MFRWIGRTTRRVVDIIHGWITWSRRRLARSRHRWLSKQARAVLRQANQGAFPTYKTELGERLNCLQGIFLVLTASLFLNVVLSATLWCLVRHLGLDHLAERLGDFVSDLWQVQASILGLTLVVVVLLIQTQSDRSNSDDLFRYFVAKSHIVPIVVYGLVQICWVGGVRLATSHSLGLPSVLHSAILVSGLSFLAFAFLNVFIYWRTLQFISPGYNRTARMDLLDRSIDRAVLAAAEEAMGNAILRKVCADLALYCSPLAGNRTDLAPIRADRYGRVTDVDLARLAALSRDLKHAVYTESQSGTAYRGFVLKELGALLGRRNDVLMRVHHTDDRQDIAATVRSVYKVSSDIREPDDALRSALALLKDEAISAIREHKEQDLDEALAVYDRALERMLRLWSAQSLPISAVSSPLAEIGRTPLTIIQRDIYDIIRTAIEIGDTHTIGPAMYLPIRLLRTALDHGEYTLYRRLSDKMIGVYHLVAANRGNKKREFVIDRCGRYLREHAEVFLSWPMEQDTTELSEIPKLGAGLVSIIQTYNGLLKAAIDLSDLDSMRAFGGALARIERERDSEGRATEIEMLEWELEGARSDCALAEDSLRLERLHALQAVWDRAHQTMRLVWFGVGAWSLRQVVGNKLDPQIGIGMVTLCADHLTDLSELSQLYLLIKTKEPGGMGWDDWVLNELPEGEVHRIDTDSWMRQFYCVQGLRLTPGEISDEGTPIQPDRHWEHELSPLEETCSGLEDAIGRLGILSELELARTDHFLELHRRAHGVALRKYEDWIIEQEISETRKREYFEALGQSYERNAVLRPILGSLGAYAEVSEFSSHETRPCSVARWTRKAFFVDDEYVTYSGFGEALGAELASAEDTLLFAAMMDAIVEGAQSESSELSDLIGLVRNRLVSKGYQPSLVIMARDTWAQQRRMLGQRRADPARWMEVRELSGAADMIDGLPIVVAGTLASGIVIVADLRAFARLGHDQGQTAASIALDIQAMGEQEARLWWEQELEQGRISNTDRREETVRRRQLDVRVNCTRHVAYRVVNPEAAVLIRIRSTEQG